MTTMPFKEMVQRGPDIIDSLNADPSVPFFHVPTLLNTLKEGGEKAREAGDFGGAMILLGLHLAILDYVEEDREKKASNILMWIPKREV